MEKPFIKSLNGFFFEKLHNTKKVQVCDATGAKQKYCGQAHTISIIPLKDLCLCVQYFNAFLLLFT